MPKKKQTTPTTPTPVEPKTTVPQPLPSPAPAGPTKPAPAKTVVQPQIPVTEPTKKEEVKKEVAPVANAEKKAPKKKTKEPITPENFVQHVVDSIKTVDATKPLVKDDEENVLINVSQEYYDSLPVEVGKTLKESEDIINTKTTETEASKLTVAVNLAKIKHERTYEQDGFKSFRDYIAKRTNVDYANIVSSIKAVETFHRMFSDPELMSRMSWKKFEAFVPALEQNVITKDEFLSTYLPQITKGSKEELNLASIKNTVGALMGAKEPKDNAKATYTLKYEGDELKLLKDCLETLRNTNSHKNDSIERIILMALSVYSDTVSTQDVPRFSIAGSVLRTLASLLPPGLMPVTFVYDKDSFKLALELYASTLTEAPATKDEVQDKQYLEKLKKFAPAVYVNGTTVVITTKKQFAKDNGATAEANFILDPDLMIEGAHFNYPFHTDTETNKYDAIISELRNKADLKEIDAKLSEATAMLTTKKLITAKMMGQIINETKKTYNLPIGVSDFSTTKDEIVIGYKLDLLRKWYDIFNKNKI